MQARIALFRPRHSCCSSYAKHKAMLRWVLTFLIIAIIAGIFGFTGIVAGAAEIAKIIFVIFLALVVLALVFGGVIWKKVSDR